MESFLSAKEDHLEDSKDSTDDPLVELIRSINNSPQLFVKSSSVGRILLINKHLGTKAGVHQVSSSRTVLDLDDCLMSFHGRRNLKGSIYLKFEPTVLNICCSTLALANAVCAAAIKADFKYSGITVGGKSGNIYVSVRSSATHALEIPITDNNGKDLVTEEYIKHNVKRANMKMSTDHDKIVKFGCLLKRVMYPRKSSKNDKTERCDEEAAVVVQKKKGLADLPKELLMTALLPFFDMASLYNLSLTNAKWKGIAQSFLKDFKYPILHLQHPSEYLLSFVAEHATKLTRLKVEWSSGSQRDNELLNRIIRRNQV